jgi:Outer membrane protein beta-barrel domain
MHTYRKLAFHTALVAGLSLFQGTASALDFGAGPLFGINLANASLDGDDAEGEETEMLTRFAFGARAELGVTSPFSVLLEPQYLQRGATRKGELLGTTFKIETRLNYLELPILAKAKFGSMKAHGYAFAGPSLGLFLNGEAELEGETEDAEDVSAFNLSGDIGVGGSYQVQEFIYLNADARYSHGFLNANDGEDDVDWMNRDIRFQLCVLFHLTK